MYRYRYFDYTLVTDLLFPELIPELIPAAEVSTDAHNVIHLKASAGTAAKAFDQVASELTGRRHVWEESGMFCRVTQGDGRYQLVFPEMLVVSQGDAELHLTYSRLCDLDDVTLRHLLVDQALPRYLSHQGDLIVHASAVSLDEVTIAFAGASGLGKSTLASAFSQIGWRILSDDCIKVSLSAGQPAQVCGGYASLRLYRDSAQSLLPDVKLAQPMGDESDKYRIRLDAIAGSIVAPVEKTAKTQAPDSTPEKKSLSLVVLLEQAVAGQSEPVLKPMSGAAALIALLSETFSLDPTLTSGALRRMDMLSVLLKQAPRVFSLSYPRDYAALPIVMDLLQDAVCAKKLQQKPVARQTSLDQ